MIPETRRLTQEEINEALRGMPPRVRDEPPIRLRYVFAAMLFVVVFGSLMVMDPMGRIAGCAVGEGEK